MKGGYFSSLATSVVYVLVGSGGGVGGWGLGGWGGWVVGGWGAL